MQNMKKVLSGLAALSLVTVAGVSTVACNNFNTKNKDNSSMDDKILFDLGVYDKDGKSQIEAKLAIKDDKVSWSADKLNNLTAANLLTDKDKAKSEESFNFLTGVLKLEAKGGGDWSTKTFEKVKADAILLTIVSIDPTLKAISDDYTVSGGTVKVQWKNDKTSFGSEYFINLKVDETKGVIKSSLPESGDLTWEDFDITKGVLANFAIGKDKNSILVGSDITNNLLVTEGKGKEIDSIAKRIVMKLELTISSFNFDGDGFDHFKVGDILNFKITLGSVQFSTEYQLKLEYNF